MTNSWFYLTLDTTPPQVEIYASTSTTPEISNTVIIQANEQLAPYQEIYVIDNLGYRVDYTFSLEGDKFVGEIKLDQQNLGIVTLYTRVKDVVHNKSNLVSKSILLGGDSPKKIYGIGFIRGYIFKELYIKSETTDSLMIKKIIDNELYIKREMTNILMIKKTIDKEVN